MRSVRFTTVTIVVAGLALATTAAAHTVTGRVVDQDGKPVPEAVIFVQSPVESPPGKMPHAAMDQINKTFVPGVLPIEVGTEVRFPNHDQIHHHVYSFSRTKSFELPLYKGQDAPPVLFDKAGVVKVGCNIHDWMSGVILVLPTSHFAKTDEQGTFTLRDLPAGTYTLAAWHEFSRTELASTFRRVTVATRHEDELAMGMDDLAFTLSLAPVRSRPAIHGSRKNP